MQKKLLFISFLSILLIGFITFGVFHNSEQEENQVQTTQSNSLESKSKNLRPKVLHLALRAYHNAERSGQVKKPYLTVIDYSYASNQKRLWVIDVNKNKVLYNTYVAHGKNSGNVNASHFSNKNGSHQTSIGTYVTKNTYHGHDGFSLRIAGLDKGFNDNAMKRAVVVHGARYVNSDFVKSHNRAGRSWGCPAVPQYLAKPIINTIKDGSVIFAYYPDHSLLSHSKYLV